MPAGTLNTAFHRVKNLTDKNRDLFRALRFFIAYLVWVISTRLLILTFLTYFVASPFGASQSVKIHEVSDAYSANEITLIGLMALLFVVMLRSLYPFSSTRSEELFTPARFEKGFLPGFLQGAVLSFCVVLAFLISGHYRYLGFFIRFDEAALALGGVLIRAVSLGALAYCEEFVFRQRILMLLGAQFRNEGRRPALQADFAAVLATSILFCLIKILQFELGIMQVFTLFLVSLAVSVRALSDRDFTRGAGFWAALLIVFQPLLSLPVLGNEFSGIVLIKYFAERAAGSALSEANARFFTGGAGGPLSSFALQLLLALDIARGLLKYKNTLGLSPASSRTRLQ